MVILSFRRKRLGIINKLMELKQKQKSISNIEDSKKIEDEIAKVNKKLITHFKHIFELQNYEQ